MFGAAEDDGESGFFVAEEVEEESAFVPGFDGDVFLGDHLCGECFGDGDDFFDVFFHVLAGECFDFAGDGGGDEDGLVVAFDLREDFADFIAEADVEHAVDFVEDDVFHVFEGEDVFLLDIHDAAGGADDDLCALFDLIDLFFEG